MRPDDVPAGIARILFDAECHVAETESAVMLWFFERSTKVLELETRYDNQTSEYVLDLRPPGVASQTERFTNAASFQKRLVALEASLEGQRWRRNGPPVVLPHGWPDRTPSE